MMDSIISFIIPLFRHYGYQILFLSSFLESLPFFGSLVPGAVVAVFGGFIARKLVLNFTLAVIALTLGAYLGDIINYFIGRHYGYSLLKKYGKYFFLTEARLEYVRGHIQRNSGKTLILGRFTAFTRSIAPFAAGASHVGIIPFLCYTLLSAFLWAFSHVLVGFVFGKWLASISRYLGLIFFLAVLVGIGLVYVYRLINQRHHIFRKFHIYTLVGMIFSLFIFTSTLQGVIDNDWMIVVNHLIADFVNSVQTPWLTSVMFEITRWGGGLYLSIAMGFIILHLISKKRYNMASLGAFSLVLGELLQFALKWIINLPRPENSMVQTISSAFPSGHATAAMIFGLFIFICFVDSIKSVWGKYVLFASCLVGILLVAFSRIYLNAHWTSDVLAGLSLGLFCITFSVLFFRVVLFIKRWLY